jgi:predicted RNase H-like nuclease
MKDLQERLNAIADKKLGKFVEDVFAPLACQNIFTCNRSIDLGDGKSQRADTVLFRLKKYVAESLLDVYRDNETTAFMGKVTQLAEQYDELQGVINAEFEVTE